MSAVLLHTDDFYTPIKATPEVIANGHGVDHNIIVLHHVKQEILTLLVPHFVPSGTTPAIMSDPGIVV